MKLAAGAFLGGARSRLLPASIPFRFFGAAVACHVLAWVALLAGAQGAPRFVGGLSPVLAAIHLLTLGVFAMAAIGASLQLLPVATRQPVRSTAAAALVFWLYVPGVLLLAAGMAWAAPGLLAAATVAILAALAVYAVLLVSTLRGASAMPAVSAHGRAAVASLLVAAATGAALVASYHGHAPLPRGPALALHVAFAAFGFMGLLALGFSLILVPMFALSPPPDERRARLALGLAVAALLLAGVAAFDPAPALLALAAFACGAGAVALHVQAMLASLATGLRRELGRSFVLVRASWALLAAAVVAAPAVLADAPLPGVATLFGVLLLPGWLLTFLLGVLQRIVPFLAAMHAAHGDRRPPTPAALTAQRPLDAHFACHFAALALLAAAVFADSPALARLAAIAGTAGAIAFAAFFAAAMRRMRSGTG